MGALSPHTQIVLAGFFAAASCATLGCFLLLRRLSLLGDAISHAVLPGIALAFLLSGSRSPGVMLLGAAGIGLLATVAIGALERSRRVPPDAAIGITFTTLFALGVVLISLYAGSVDLDQDCVLYGEIGYVPLEPSIRLGALDLGPAPLVALAAVFLLDLACVTLLWKELKLSSFDPALATAMGFSATLLHYVLMALTSLTVVAAFDAVGAILVVAMIVAPAATAYLLTDRLLPMLLVSLLASAASAVLGKQLASATATSIAGAMATVAGALFALALLFAPRHGVLSRALHRLRMRLRIARENLVVELLRTRDRGLAHPGLAPIAARLHWSRPFARLVLRSARRRDLVAGSEDELVLLARGRDLARAVYARHRAWQRRLEQLGYDREHAHASAHRLEHTVAPEALAEADEEETEP